MAVSLQSDIFVSNPYEPAKSHEQADDSARHIPRRMRRGTLSMIVMYSFCVAVLAVVAEILLGVGSFLIDHVPYDSTLVAGPLCILAATGFGALAHWCAAPAGKSRSFRLVCLPLVVCYAFLAVCALTSLVFRWESGGRYSEMANGICLIRAAALVTYATATCEFVFWAIRAPRVWVHLVYVTMIAFVAPVAYQIVFAGPR